MVSSSAGAAAAWALSDLLCALFAPTRAFEQNRPWPRGWPTESASPPSCCPASKQAFSWQFGCFGLRHESLQSRPEVVAAVAPEPACLSKWREDQGFGTVGVEGRGVQGAEGGQFVFVV